MCLSHVLLSHASIAKLTFFSLPLSISPSLPPSLSLFLSLSLSLSLSFFPSLSRPRSLSPSHSEENTSLRQRVVHMQQESLRLQRDNVAARATLDDDKASLVAAKSKVDVENTALCRRVADLRRQLDRSKLKS